MFHSRNRELREENNSNRTSDGSSAKQRTIERPESGASRNPGEGTEIDPRGSKRSTERDVEDLQQNKRPLTEDQREHPNVQACEFQLKESCFWSGNDPRSEKIRQNLSR